MKPKESEKFNHKTWPDEIAKIYGVSPETARGIHMWATERYEDSFFNNDGKLERYLESLKRSKFKFTLARIRSFVSKLVERAYEDSWIESAYYWAYRFCYSNITQRIRERKMRKQRMYRGFSDSDWWNIDIWMSTVLADAIDMLAKNTSGTPTKAAYLMGGKTAELYKHPENITDKEWARIHKWWKGHLAKIAFCLRESNEDTCSLKNDMPFVYHKNDTTRDSEYPYFYTRKDDLTDEEKRINEAYFKREMELSKYREKQFKKALLMLSELHGMLWD